MDFFVQNWVLISIALSSGLMIMWPTLSGGAGGGSISPTQAVQMINREKAVVVDVCSPEEFASGHLVGAKNVPVDQIDARLAQVAKNKSTPLVLVCASGVRSRRAAAAAKKMGYENVHTLAGGMGAWRSANLPLKKG